MTFGFQLLELTVSGTGKPDATVAFEQGLNVIAGPSDTGKTYIFECLDFILGASTPPKAVPEAEGYETVRLSLTARASEEIVLERSLRGGDVRLSASGVKERILKAKHAADDPDTISAFLLELSGLANRRVRTNASGGTRSVSFRDLAQLALVDEESVMTARSPALSGQWTARTVESRIFRLLLTGEDDSSLITAEDPKVAQGRRTGQVEVLETVIQRIRASHQDLAPPESIDAAEIQLAELRQSADRSLAALTGHQQAATQIEERRRAAWTELRTVESRAGVLRELADRFGLLQQQYRSDLARLEAIAEAGVRLEQMTEERCPVCGALAEHHQHEHAEAAASPADVTASCRAEVVKITVLLEDLSSTQEANSAELQALMTAREARASELDNLDSELQEALKPKLEEAARDFRAAEAARQGGERTLELLRTEDELRKLLADGIDPPKKKPQPKLPTPTVSAGEADNFAREAEKLLKAWHFPGLTRVTFSEEDQDLVISGRARASHGKGVRAITHAAFVLALLRLCLDSGLPFPGLVVIDSPLVVYREPDPEEGSFPSAVKEHFYESIAQMFKDGQVLIVENDAPPTQVAGDAHVITFTKTAQGRSGFFPTA